MKCGGVGVNDLIRIYIHGLHITFYFLEWLNWLSGGMLNTAAPAAGFSGCVPHSKWIL